MKSECSLILPRGLYLAHVFANKELRDKKLALRTHILRLLKVTVTLHTILRSRLVVTVGGKCWYSSWAFIFHQVGYGTGFGLPFKSLLWQVRMQYWMISLSISKNLTEHWRSTNFEIPTRERPLVELFAVSFKNLLGQVLATQIFWTKKKWM